MWSNSHACVHALCSCIHQSNHNLQPSSKLGTHSLQFALFPQNVFSLLFILCSERCASASSARPDQQLWIIQEDSYRDGGLWMPRCASLPLLYPLLSSTHPHGFLFFTCCLSSSKMPPPRSLLSLIILVVSFGLLLPPLFPPLSISVHLLFFPFPPFMSSLDLFFFFARLSRHLCPTPRLSARLSFKFKWNGFQNNLLSGQMTNNRWRHDSSGSRHCDFNSKYDLIILRSHWAHDWWHQQHFSNAKH